MKDEYFKKLGNISFREGFLKKQREKIFLKLEHKSNISRLWLVPAFSLGIIMLVFFLKNGSFEKQNPSNLAFYQSIDMLEDMEVLQQVSEEELR